MVHTANYRHLVPGVSVIKGLRLYKFAPKGRDFVSVVRDREGAYYRGFFRGNVSEFCWYVGNCPYWRGVRMERFDCIYIYLYLFFIYFMGIINTDGKRKKRQTGCEQKLYPYKGPSTYGIQFFRA